MTITAFAKNNAVNLWWPASTPGGLLPNLYNISESSLFYQLTLFSLTNYLTKHFNHNHILFTQA